jgi:hypothetical protein
MNLMQDHYPLLLQNAQRYFTCVYDNVYECGIECGSAFTIPDYIDLEILRILGGMYAVLADDCFGDIHVGRAKMDLWLVNNSIAHVDKPIFAVYETRNGKYDTDSVRMKLYKRLKDDKNG